jgi:secondary thiamine-phosphate synthase enzyme
MPAVIEVETATLRQVLDITERVGAAIAGRDEASRTFTGVCHLYLRHTTAALAVMTWEEGVPEDIMDILQALTPKLAARHDSPAHVAAHFLSALVGPSTLVPVDDGRLALGEFQRIALFEFEGPRRRSIEMRLCRAA